MPTMSRVQSAFCRSAPWRVFTRRLVLPWALQGTIPKGHALEVGGGSGAMAAELLRAYPDLRVTVTDFDEAMVEAAARRLRAFGDRAIARQADATALPFADETFDIVFSFIMLHHTVRWEQALNEAVRVLRPGGQLVGYDLLASRPMRLFHRAEGAQHRMIHRDELHPALNHLPMIDVRIDTGIGGVVGRFSGRRDSPRS